MRPDQPETTQAFPSTNWSLVKSVPKDATALNELIRRYMPALRAHLVLRKRVNPHDADDLLNEFLSEKVVEHDLIGRADQRRGKFRTYLLTALDRFLTDQHRRRNAAKRKFEAQAGAGTEDLDIVDLDERGPIEAYHVAWASATLQEALRRMEERCLAEGRPDRWGVFESRTLAETIYGEEPLPYPELVKRYGYETPKQASNAKKTAERMYARILLEVLAEYTDDPADIESELNDLHRILARAPLSFRNGPA